MGIIFGILIILALYFTIFCLCKYKDNNDVIDALNAAEKDLTDKEKGDK